MAVDWGGTTAKGFTPVSRAFLRSYVQLGMSLEEAMLVLHILDYAWTGALPFPKVATLCRYTGKSDQTIRTYIRSLRAKGVLITAPHSGRSQTYDFTPLFKMIASIANSPEVDEGITELKARISGEALTPQDLGSQPTEDSGSPYKKNNDLEEDSVQQTKFDGVSEIVAQVNSRLGPSKRKPISPRSARANSSEKPLSEYNCNDLERVWRDAWDKTFDSPCARWVGRDRKNAKDLITDFGAENMVKVVTEFVTRWSEIASHFGMNGFPSVRCLYGWRGTVVPHILAPSQSASGAKKVVGTQFDSNDSRDDGSKIGW